MRTGKRKRRHMRSIRVVGWMHTLMHLRLTNAIAGRRHYRALLSQNQDRAGSWPRQLAKYVGIEARYVHAYRAYLRSKYTMHDNERGNR